MIIYVWSNVLEIIIDFKTYHITFLMYVSK